MGAGVVVVIVFMPIGDTARGQLLGLLGLLLSAAVALSSTTFIGNAMAGLMLRAVRNFRTGDFIRIGEYKSAPEQFTQKKMSEAAREQTRTLVDDVHRRMRFDLAANLDVSEARVVEIMNQGPQLVETAMELGMVDAAVDGFDLRDQHLPELFAEIEGLSAEAMGTRLLTEVDRFVGEEPRSDDLSLMVLKRL